MSLILLIEQVLNGVQSGVMLFLMAAGLTLIFGTLGVVNFAHGALFMIGAFCAVTLSRIHAHTPDEMAKLESLKKAGQWHVEVY